ncbi:hypothetical protein ACPCTO_23720 [Streptomyces olivoreticuli]
MDEQIAPPEISAALFKAAAEIPGVALVDKATDATAVTSESVVVKRAVVNAKRELPGGGTINSGG